MGTWAPLLVKSIERQSLALHSLHISNMPVDAESIKKICDIYDWDGKGEIDLFYLGDVFYALGLNTTKKVCVGLGQTDDVVAKVMEGKDAPNSSGNYHDFVELLRLYDKNSNGTMMLAELETLLANMGDEIPKEDVQKLLGEL